MMRSKSSLLGKLQPARSVRGAKEGENQQSVDEHKSAAAGGAEVNTKSKGCLTEGGVRYELFQDHASVRGLDGKPSIIEIPAKVSGLPVTVIGKDAFQASDSLTQIELPETIATIGARAFQNCSALEKIELPPNLEVINTGTFEGCFSLRTVQMPYELRRICKRSFKNCKKLESTPHFVKTGISATMRVDRGIVEENLPTAVEYIGEEAFAGCSNLPRVVVPYQVTKLGTAAFKGCSQLSSVWLHSKVEELADEVFAGCLSLEEIRLPNSLRRLGNNCFEDSVVAVCEEDLPVLPYMQRQVETLRFAAVGEFTASRMGEDGPQSVEALLSDQARLDSLIEAYEVRPSVDRVIHERFDDCSGVQPARFALKEGVYEAKAADDITDEISIALVGDLMCRVFQQRYALENGVYDFSASFDQVRGILQGSDLSIGNMESMIARSFPYMHESQYVDDRPHLNAPFAYLKAVRNAGFDVVMNSQNHMYDTGALGVAETLGALNNAELIHGGMYIHPDEQRYLLVRTKGICIGIVGYLDGARQKMKQANLSDQGLRTMAGHFDNEQISKDIADARDAGAEFILAYGHWGREYTDNITARQERFAQLLADSGADYVFGSHSHCPQQYTILESEDGRRVPVVYSGGNFLSDIGIKKPITQDSLIGLLSLTRDQRGKVIVKSDGYIPCRIQSPRRSPGAVSVVPCLTPEGRADNPADSEACRRIGEAMGNLYKQTTMRAMRSNEGVSEDVADVVERYSVRQPLMAHIPKRVGPAEPAYRFEATSSLWRPTKRTAQGEVTLVCTGSILYDEAMEEAGDVGDRYEFRAGLRNVQQMLRDVDLTIGSLGSVVAPDFPSISVMNSNLAGGHYSNARPEFLDALQYGGFDCLALANPYNLDAGVSGLISTERSVLANGLVPTGIGEEKTPVFDVNGIKIAPLSFTLDAYKTRTMITGEGANALLNVFDEQRVLSLTQDLRAKGVDFIPAYLDCRSASQKYRYAERLEAARKMAEAGADYVICVLPAVVSKFVRYRTSDGRIVPIATSLGTFVSGRITEKDQMAAALRITVRMNAQGALDVDDCYIPLKRFEYYGGASHTVAPALRAYNPKFAQSNFKNVRGTLGPKLGEELSVDGARRVKMLTHNHPQLTPAEIAALLETDFSSADKRSLGKGLNKKVARVVTRKGDLTEGCIAVLAQQHGYQRDSDQLTVDDAIRAGAICVIASQTQKGVPCLVVDDPWKAFATVAGTIRENYSPLTVAVTGTVGKTTTKELMDEVFDRHYRTLHIEGNNNTIGTAGIVVQKLTAEDEAYIQEVHGGTMGSAQAVSRLIRPDICLITNIGDGHLAQMGTIENVITGKMQIIDGMREGGTLVLNNDNEYLREQHPDVNVVRYSMSDPSCPYYAKNIQNHGESIEFQIVSPEGVFDALLNFQGLHNVSNAVAVFAVSRLAGIPPHKIIAGLSRYVPDSVRQNLVEVGSYRLLIDTYSSTPLSVLSAIETLCQLPIEQGARRVAVVGDIPDLGAKSKDDHIEVGEKIGHMPFDYLLCCGEDSRYLVESARKQGMKAEYFQYRREMNRAIVELIKPNDIVLFKAGTRVHLKEETIYPLFGEIV